MFGIGAQEMLVILVVALLVFGPKRLPELARTVGKGLAEFRRASTDMRQAFNVEEQPHKIEPPPGPAQAGAPSPPPEEARAELASDESSPQTGTPKAAELGKNSKAAAEAPEPQSGSDAAGSESELASVPVKPRTGQAPGSPAASGAPGDSSSDPSGAG